MSYHFYPSKPQLWFALTCQLLLCSLFGNSAFAEVQDSSVAKPSKWAIGLGADRFSIAFARLGYAEVYEPFRYDGRIYEPTHETALAQGYAIGLSLKRLLGPRNDANGLGLDLQYVSASHVDLGSPTILVYNKLNNDSLQVKTQYRIENRFDIVHLRLSRCLPIGHGGLALCFAPVLSCMVGQYTDSRLTLDTAYRWFLPGRNNGLILDSNKNQLVFRNGSVPVLDAWSAGCEIAFQYQFTVSGFLIEPCIGAGLEFYSIPEVHTMSYWRFGLRCYAKL